MTRTVPVRLDGMISLPLLNDVQAAGFTPLELRDRLMARRKDHVPSPEVSVIVMEVKSVKVSVMGAVRKPGRYELRSWATVMDMLAMAEGFTDDAVRSRIVVLRPNGRSTEVLNFDFDRVRSANSVWVNFYVRPGDIVVVP